MEPICPHYQAPKLIYIKQVDDYMEGAAMCRLVDKTCLMEYGEPCEEYKNYLKELEDEGN